MSNGIVRVWNLSCCIMAITSPAAIHGQANGDTTHAIVDGPIGARADSVLARLQASGFSGVALVAQNGRVVLKKGYGLANRASSVPMTGNSIVQIGSNTKDFTIVSVLQLVERGRVRLDDSLTKYFAGVPIDKRGITVRELMFHQAGFDQHLGPDWDPVSQDEEVARALGSPLLFQPGADRKYSNIGYSLLAAIIERVSGMPYDEFVRDNILKPLDLRETGLLLPHFDPARVAHGYRDGADAGTFLDRPHAADGPYWNLRGNGGMLSTVSDMYRFYRALMGDGPLLTSATRDIFFHPSSPAVLAGSDLTFFFFYSRYPAAGFDIILVSNSTDYPAPTARGELDAALGIGPPPGARIGGPGMSVSIDTGLTPAGRRGGTSALSPNTGQAGTIAAIPSTPVGRAVIKYLAAYRTGDTATIRQFLEAEVIRAPTDTRSLDQRVANYVAMHDDLGALTPVAIDSASEYDIAIRFRGAQGNTALFSFSVEHAPPHRITGLRVERR